MKNTRQISYWTLAGFDGNLPIEKAMESAKKMGYGGIEPALGHADLVPGVSEARCKEIRRCAKGLGLEMTTMATVKYWDLSLSDPKTSARNKAIAYTKEYLQVAKWLGLKVVLVIPGAVDVFFKPDFKAVPYAQVWKLATDSIRRLLPTAQKLGVTMAVENVWNYFLTDPMAMRAFVDQFKSPRLGVYFDVGNCVVTGYPEHWIEILGRRIKAVHIKSFQRCGGAGTAEGFTDDLKKPDINWRSVIAGLRKIKYTGPLTAEMPPSMAVARNTAKTMKAIFG